MNKFLDFIESPSFTLPFLFVICTVMLFRVETINSKVDTINDRVTIQAENHEKTFVPVVFSTDYLKNRSQDLKCLQEALYFEAANQEIQGQMAIAQLTRVRERSKYYANDVCAVIKQPLQYSYFSDGKSDIPDLSKSPNRKAWTIAKRVSEIYVEDDYMVDPDLKYATVYHAYYVKPDWDWSQLIFIKQIGDHKFYMEKRVLKELCDENQENWCKVSTS